MIFRWNIWGNKKNNLELLHYSIRSFRKQFGDKHRYIIFTDCVQELEDNFSSTAEINEFNEHNKFNIASLATWKKWCPAVRIDRNQHEFYVDSDVFLLRYPDEVDQFISNPDKKFAIMDEFNGQHWQHGAMHQKATKDTPYVNAGFFIQKAGSDISVELINEFNWWKQNIPTSKQTHHDEQGALAIALTKYLRNNELYILPKNKYMLIGPNENNEIKNLNEVTMFHAVYPEHPAFYRFKPALDKIL